MTSIRRTRPWLAALAILATCSHVAPQRERIASPPGPTGMVASDAALATQIGVDVLKRGGNAIDAAVATAFALAVVFPQAGNLGGGGFLVLRLADGTNVALDFRETAPRAATRDMYTGVDHAGQSLTGHLACGVPGSVAGLWEAHTKHGTQDWAALVRPAIELAENGFTVDLDFAASVGREAERLARFPASAALYLPGGTPLAQGMKWRNTELTHTLRLIAAKGPAGFYEGETADRIVEEMQSSGGLITHEDLRAYRPIWRKPIEFDYRGYHVVSMPPPSSGGLVLALMANILRPYDLKASGGNSPESIHLLAEAMRRAFALRNQHLGDPDFVPIPSERFLAEKSANLQRASISPARATPSAQLSAGIGSDAEGTHTTHFSVVDRYGNAVALTTTLNTGYGSAVTVPGAGFLLNNEMDDFATSPGTPNTFGLIQGEANAIAPGKRMLSSMTPTIVAGPDGHVALVTGAAGGPTIITTVFQHISNVVDHGMDAASMATAPRIHHQHLPDSILYETLSQETMTKLKALGHELKLAPRGIGDAPSILWAGDRWTGITESRRSGSLVLGE